MAPPAWRLCDPARQPEVGDGLLDGRVNVRWADNAPVMCAGGEIGSDAC